MTIPHSTINLFFLLIRMGIGSEKYSYFPTLTSKEWISIIDTAMKQALVGILIDGVEKLPQEKKPERSILMKLIGIGLKIEDMNRRVNRKAMEVSEFYKKKGFSPVLLKGQGTATFYSRPEHRMPGDIDLWLTDGRDKVTDFVKKQSPEAEVLYHHIHLKEKDGIEVEIHSVPTFMYNPIVNNKLQRLFSVWKDMTYDVKLPDNAGKVCIPCDEMNRVYMLIHKYRHLFSEGIGMRQMVDYMMLLRKGFTEEERIRAVNILRELHLTEFCRSVMYVLKNVLGMEDRFLLLEPAEDSGRKLLEEILMAGNFGQYDERIDRNIKKDSIESFITRNKRNMRFLREYTNEVVWAPYFKIFNWFWRRKNN